jgi:hypothetical protein
VARRRVPNTSGPPQCFHLTHRVKRALTGGLARSNSSANCAHVCASLSNSMASAWGAVVAILRQCIAWSRHSVGVERMAKQLRRAIWVPKKKPRTRVRAGASGSDAGEPSDGEGWVRHFLHSV